MNILLPSPYFFFVYLKYAVCIITESVSIKYTKPINIRCIGIFRSIAISATDAPKKSEPVSPINTFAGYLLYHKNPIKPPINATENTVTPYSLNTIYDTSIKNIPTIVVILDAKPSSPSVRFTAFTTPTTTNITNGM